MLVDFIRRKNIIDVIDVPSTLNKAQIRIKTLTAVKQEQCN
jgi:hypothetical protein